MRTLILVRLFSTSTLPTTSYSPPTYPSAPTAFCITSARTGLDDNHFELISGSMIVSPQGRILAENKTTSDELIVADVDLDECKPGKSKTFCFERHRRVECYGRIVGQRGVVEPEEE